MASPTLPRSRPVATPLPLLLLREAPEGTGRPDAGADEAPGPGDGGRRIVCRACGQAVTTREARTERGGSHGHVFANPHGYVFELALFSAAPGCRCEGPPSTEFPWFPGCSWQVDVCRGCSLHLGWRFLPLAGGAAFHGLIADRIVEADERK